MQRQECILFCPVFNTRYEAYSASCPKESVRYFDREKAVRE